MVSLRQPEAPLPPTLSWRELSGALGELSPLWARLGPAERLVAMQLAQGLSNREIARALGKSEFTVKNQVSTILAKTGAKTRIKLVLLLLQMREGGEA
ncbi:MAG TPA: LuxR C-terminal-related transcriptional regulator [Opitutaceae bacterium]|nr:LuxR C-terminal-related transcriptional regulator [Opitutaceae bacterium]